jgi:quinol monooxygenase YgiN
MIILRQQMRSKPERTEDVWAALAAIVPGARATPGVVSLDIARDLLDPDSFVATAVYEDAAAVERQESAPEVHAAMAIFPDALAAPPDRKFPGSHSSPPLSCAVAAHQGRGVDARLASRLARCTENPGVPLRSRPSAAAGPTVDSAGSSSARKDASRL